jgi:hypothetical protein
MLLIVYRESLEEEIHALLSTHHVKAELHKVGGTGETGAAFHSFTWPGVNGLILTALQDGEAERVEEGFRVFCKKRCHEQHGAKIPLRVFVLPCSQMV